MSQVAELNLRRAVREVLREELTSGDSATKRLLLDLLKQAIREELTSGDPATRRLLSELTLSAVLKDSAGAELSSYLKNLDVLLSSRASESTLSAIKSKTENLDVSLSTRASEATLSGIKSQTDKFTFDADGNLQVNARVTANPPNLDVALSTRASESTLSAIAGALASKATDKLRVSPVDPLPRSPFTLYDSAGNELSSYVKNLNVALTSLARLIRLGRDAEPAWVYGSEVTAPAAGTALVSKTVSTGKSGYVYGLYISTDEANVFKLKWTSGGEARSIRIPFGSGGALLATVESAINEGLPADAGSTISIINVNAGTGVYQAGILYLEV